MDILLLAPRCPWPAFDGGRQRTLALVRALAGRHAVTLSTPFLPGELEKAQAGLAGLVAAWLPAPAAAGDAPESAPDGEPIGRLADIGAEILDPRPSRLLRFASPEWAGLLDRHGWDRFDAIVCRYSRQAFLVPPALADRLVIDADDLAHRIAFQRFLTAPHRPWTWPVAVEAVRSRSDELRLLRRARRVLVCSEDDRRRVGGRNVSVVRNGTNLPAASSLREPAPGVMSFIGNFSHDPNREGLDWFVAEVLPLVVRAAPTACLEVAGYRSLEAGAAHAANPGVRLLGAVPDAAACFSGSTVSVVPLRRGAGTRIKVLDALACGRPVVSTIAGADGLDGIDESHGLYRARTAAQMAGLIASALQAPGPFLAAADRGRELVRTTYTWEITTGGLAASLEEWIGVPQR